MVAISKRRRQQLNKPILKVESATTAADMSADSKPEKTTGGGFAEVKPMPMSFKNNNSEYYVSKEKLKKFVNLKLR